MGVSELRSSWENLTPAARIKGGIAGVVLVLAVGWIAYVAWPEPAPVAVADPETKAALETFNADQSALRAMSVEQLTQEIKKREAAFQKASKGGTAADFEAAMSNLARAKEVMIEKKQAGGA